MNTKTLTTLVVLFILINAGLFIFLNKENFFKKQAPPAPVPKNSSDLSLDAASDGVALTYNFKGKVTKITSRQNGEVEIKLDTYPNQTPEFLVTKDSEILIIKNGKNEPAAVTDLKAGTSVDITMVLNKKTWTLKTVTIQPESL